MPKKKLFTQTVDGHTYTEGEMCPHCECDTMLGDEGDKLICSGCGLDIDCNDYDCCNFDNGHNCDECDDEYCHACGSYGFQYPDEKDGEEVCSDCGEPRE
jgi:hypothetical protein